MNGNKYSVNDFKLLSVIGYGNYAKVALVKKKDDDKIYAMKIVKKKGKVKGIKKSHALIEKQILMKSSHPFIIKMHTTFQDETRLFFILDYCPGGQLFGLIRRVRRLSQQNCRFYAAQILLALEYLHSKKIIYRDLKPENLVLDHKGYIRLVDFGLSIDCEKGQELSQKDLAGTAYYLAPESLIKSAKISFTSDWWSFGCLIFELIMGFPPFYSNKEDIKTLILRIKNDQPPLQYINSEVLRDFLKQLLKKDPQKRLGHKNAEQLKVHPWLKGINWQRINRKTITAPFIPKLASEHDTNWFDQDILKTQLSPPQLNQMKCQDYNQFSLSWQSSSQRSPKQSPPQQITLLDIQGEGKEGEQMILDLKESLGKKQ